MMKNRTLVSLSAMPGFRSICLLAGLFLVSCGTSSTGLERSNETTDVMQSVETDITSTVDNIDAIESSLNELIRPGQRDIVSAFEEYSQHLDQLEESGNQYVENIAAMDEQAETYFQEWEDENYDNPRIAEISENRRTEVREAYSQINYQGLQNELGRFLENNREIRQYLSNDLTSEGIESMTPLIEDTIDDSNTLRNELLDVQESVENARESMDQQGRMDERDRRDDGQPEEQDQQDIF